MAVVAEVANNLAKTPYQWCILEHTVMKFYDKEIEVISDDMVAVLKKKSGTERLKIAFALVAEAQLSLRRYVALMHPEWTEKQVQAEVAKRISHGAV